MSSSKPAIFIGSSVEQLEIANTMQEHLEYVSEPTVWTQDIFKPSSYALTDLLKAAQTFQFALFIFAADDMITMRGSQSNAVRDNVIFEFGLFVGALGLPCCFLVTPRNAAPLHLPTDLLGLTAMTYDADRSDRNLVAALGPVVNRIRRSIREQLAARDDLSPTAYSVDGASNRTQRFRKMTAKDFIESWNEPVLMAARQAVRELPSSPPGYDEDEAPAHQALRRIFTFLESLADTILSGEIEENAARGTFKRPVRVLWPHMFTLMAPLNHAEDWWQPLPKIAELYGRWVEPAKRSPA